MSNSYKTLGEPEISLGMETYHGGANGPWVGGGQLLPPTVPNAAPVVLPVTMSFIEPLCFMFTKTCGNSDINNKYSRNKKCCNQPRYQVAHLKKTQ